MRGKCVCEGGGGWVAGRTTRVAASVARTYAVWQERMRCGWLGSNAEAEDEEGTQTLLLMYVAESRPGVSHTTVTLENRGKKQP